MAGADPRPSFTRFVALGDSTTEGLEDPYPDGSYRGWADRLAEILCRANPGLEYANLAVRGRKVQQIRAEQLEPAIALRPDLASTLGGINDVLRRRIDMDAVVADLEAMTTGLRNAGATVLTFTFPDPTAVINVAASRIRSRVASFNSRIRRMSDASGGVLVDLERDGIAHPALWCEDRLHANSGGHERIAAAAAAALGCGDDDESWSLPLSDPVPRSAAARCRDDVVWMGKHLAPWLVRRARGRSSGDGRTAKRPIATGLEPKGQVGE